MAHPRLDVTTQWDTIRSYLPADYAERAQELKQLQLQYGNAKIRTADDLLRLILLHVGADLPLRQTVALMAEAGGPVVSHVRLHKKLYRATPFLRSLVRSMADVSEAQPERWAGYDVLAVDATAVCGPGADNTDARLHVQLRLADLEIVSARVDGLNVGESLKLFRWAPGQLVVADRGYCHAPGIAAAVTAGADVLVRLNRGSLPLSDSREDPIDLMGWLRTLPGHGGHERVAYIRNKETSARIQGRLVAVHLPPAQAEAAVARLVRERGGSKVSAADREAAAYVVLFTTVPQSRMNSDRCIDLYRLRWQIELLFKRWKSLCGFDRLPNYLDDTILAWLHAKLLLALLMERMAVTALSPPEDASSPSTGRPSTMDRAAVEAHVCAVARDSRGAAAARVA